MIALLCALVFTPDRVDFGTFPETDSPAATVTLANTGAEPVKILEVVKTCGCSEATLESDTLAPGETTRLHLRLQPVSLSGPFTKSLFLRTPSGLETLAFTGTAQPRFSVSPQSTLPLGSTFTLRPHGQSRIVSARLQNSPPGTLNLQTNGTEITVSLAANQAALPAGHHLWTILLETAPEDPHPIRLHVTAETGLRLACIPRTLRINDPAKPLTLNLHLRASGGTLDPARLILPPLPPGFTLQAGTNVTPRGLPLTLTYTPQANPNPLTIPLSMGDSTTTLTIHFPE